MRGPSRPRAVAFVRKPRCGICTWTATQCRVFVSTARATPPNLSFADCETLSTLFLLYGSLWNVPGCFSRNLNVSAPAVSPLILQPDSSGYGAASTVLYGLAVFHSAVLCICQYAAGPLRHQGDHRPQIRRAVGPTGRGRRGARHAMERLRDVKFCKLHAYVSVLGAVPVHASRYAESAGTDWFGAVRCIVAGHPVDQLAQHG